jgi:polyhydroxyalkanoate synthase
VYRSLLGGGFADLRRMPSEVIFDEPKCTVHRYEPTVDPVDGALPVLLIPPMAATPVCFDLRRGCSMVEFLLDTGRPTYLVDYGDISTLRDQDLGLEHWIDSVLPDAIAATIADSGADGVHLVGWCLGGILEMFTAAAHPDLPIVSVTSVASPFDFGQVRVLAPVRLLEDLTGGVLTTGLVRALGGVPGKLNGWIYRWLDPVKQIKKPLVQLQSRGDPDTLAQIEAVDVLMDTMEAYPGRSISQIYHSLIRTNRMSQGCLHLKNNRVVELRDVTVPVMAIAGTGDLFFAPPASAHHVASLLTNSPHVRLDTAPGGHLGVLTGRAARDTTWTYVDEFLSENDGNR